LDGALNCHHEEWLYIASGLDKFCIKQISREEDVRGNTLAQQASRYEVNEGKFIVKRRWDESESADGNNVVKEDWRNVVTEYIKPWWYQG
jgi:hypothetical protein